MSLPVEKLLCKATFLATKFERGRETVYIDDAIVLDREALVLCPPSHPTRSTALSRLASHLWNCYEQLGGIDDLNTAIDLDRDALALHPPGHPNRPASLSKLTLHLSARYKQLGRIDDLNEPIDLDRDALVLRPPGHSDRCMSLNNLANRLWRRYKQLGAVDDLNEAIDLDRDALVLYPPRDPDRSMILNNLAAHLHTRFTQLGGIDDLSEAIVLTRDALMLRPPGHPDRSRFLINLATHLSIRYHRLGGIDDFNEGIVLARDALALRPPGHPHRSSSLINFANQLSTRYDQLGGIDDLNEAIIVDRDALALCLPGHPDRSTSLSNLANQLSARYKRFGGIDDMNEAVVLTQDALALCPPGHLFRSMSLNDLAFHLSVRYKHLGRIDDLNDAVFLACDALALRPPGYPGRSTSLEHLAEYLCARFMRLGDADDRDEPFSLYAELELISHWQTISSYDLFAAKAWVNAAEHFHHHTTPLAYQTALRFLVQHLAALPSLPHHLAVLKALSSSLATDALSACLRNHSPSDAVELLEQGRGVFWGQLNRLRSPLDDVIASGPAGEVLANGFTRLTSLIRNALDSPGPSQHCQVCHLNSELEQVVSNIRELPGLSRFLLPPLFSDLQRAASGGPVIIVNASQYGCDALVVFVDRDPVHIPLSITKARVRELSSELHNATERAKTTDVRRDLGVFLRELWNNVVSHIVEYLLTTYPRQSRIWWCPTAEFSHLPLHAAGPYRKGEQNLSSLYISSYTPTLAALIRARRPSSSNSATERKHFIAIGQANAIGTSELASVGTELANIGQCVDGLAKFTRIEGQDSCISRVADELGQNEWVHLACHGLPNRKQPFESAFALHDGRFTIQHIIQSDLKNPEFAYLSACHTTVGDEESPDEVIHLASGMQFAGFRSVIGTMWAVDDEHTNKVTSMFYKHMVDESGRLDHTRAAFALRMTMKSVNIPLDQRILYIHLGA